MREVARAAGVSVETVYANFGSKGDLLKASIDLAVVGDSEPVPLDRRPEFVALGRGTRSQRARAAARLIARVTQRTAGLVLALREAAASDADLARWRRAAEQRRHSDIEHAASLIAGRTIAREESDGLWAVLTVEVYELLTELRGWDLDRYERWLAGVIDRLLPASGRRP